MNFVTRPPSPILSEGFENNVALPRNIASYKTLKINITNIVKDKYY